MALLFMEGWDWLPDGYSASQMLSIFYADGASDATNSHGDVPTVQQGRFGLGKSVQLPRTYNATGNLYRKVLPTRVEGEFVVGLAIRGTIIGSYPLAVFGMALYDSDTGQNLFSFTMEPEGVWEVRCGGAFVAKSRPGLWFLGSWHFVQLKALPGELGSLQLVVDGEIVIDVSGRDFTPGTPTPPNTWGFDCYTYYKDGFGQTELYTRVDDLYILDTTGPAPYNDYLGNIRVGVMLPDAPGDSTTWTPVGAGSNWEAVVADVDLNFNTDTTYVSTDGVGNTDLYHLQANVPTREIFGVQMRAFYRQTDAIQLFSQNVIKTGGVEYYGDVRGVSQSYVGRDTIWEVNPGTTLPWTDVDLADVQIGPKLQASD